MVDGGDMGSDDDEFGGFGRRQSTKIYTFDYNIKFDDDLDEGDDFKR